MPFRYQKRIGGNKGLGVNLSKTGISTSYRSSFGAFGSRGFSIRTGIPGLSFRQYNRKGDGFITLFLILFMATIGLAVLIVYNLFAFIVWCIESLFTKQLSSQIIEQPTNEVVQEPLEQMEPIPLMYGEDYGIEINGVDPLFMQVASLAVMLQIFNVVVVQKSLGLFPERTKEIAKQLEKYGILGKQKLDGSWPVLIVNEIQLSELIENIQSHQRNK